MPNPHFGLLFYLLFNLSIVCTSYNVCCPFELIISNVPAPWKIIDFSVLGITLDAKRDLASCLLSLLPIKL